MDFLHKKPHNVGDELPVHIDFEVDDIEAGYAFELWDYTKENCLGKLAERKRHGCYVTVILGEEHACHGAGHYQIKVSKDCQECGCLPIKMDYECHVELVSSTSGQNKECKICE